MTGWHGFPTHVAECEHCGKRCYSSRRMAKAVRRRMPPDGQMRAYRCPRNNTIWHLGHLPPEVSAGAMTAAEKYGGGPDDDID